jgi:predicted transcriptional regulator
MKPLELLEKISDLEETIEIHTEGLKETEKELIKALREYREQEEISLTDLAEKWGITKAYLSDIELGRRKISDRIYKKLWEIFE